MSDDLRALLHAAAPVPAAPVDVATLERRARRIVLVRLVAAVAATAVVAASVTAVVRVDGRTETVVGDPRPQPAPHEVDTDALPRENRIPPGRRYEIASGVFGDDWGERSGLRWRLLVWGRGQTSCWQVATDETKRNEGLACSRDRGPENVRSILLGGSSSFLTESSDPAEYQFVAGYVGPLVERLEFRGDHGPVLTIPLHRAPAVTGVPYSFYAMTLPFYDFADLVALSEDGDVLETHHLCGEGCREQRERQHDTDVIAFEIAPVTERSAAAAFAVAAAGQAGLIDELGTLWGYRGISGDGLYLARFRATDCSGADAGGGYRCARGSDPATIRVAVRDDRFVVAGATGPMTDEQRTALESFSEPVRDDVKRWRQVDSWFARRGPRKWDVGFTVVWTGNLGAPRDYGSACRFVVYAPRRQGLYRSRLFPFRVRTDEREYYRVSGLMTRIETRRAPRDLVVECDEPGPGVLERSD